MFEDRKSKISINNKAALIKNYRSKPNDYLEIKKAG